jgi:hypothetical protein
MPFLINVFNNIIRCTFIYIPLICEYPVTGRPEPKDIELDFINFKDRGKGISYVNFL